MRTLGWILMTSIFLMIFFRLFFPFYFLLRAETEQDLAIPPPPDLASLLRASGDFRTQAADLAPIYANPSLVRRRQCGIRNPESGMAAMIVEFFDLCFFSSHLISMKWVTLNRSYWKKTCKWKWTSLHQSGFSKRLSTPIHLPGTEAVSVKRKRRFCKKTKRNAMAK